MRKERRDGGEKSLAVTPETRKERRDGGEKRLAVTPESEKTGVTEERFLVQSRRKSG